MRVLGKLWQERWPILRWSLFILMLAGVGVGLYVIVPPEPRWVLAGGPMSAFATHDGHIATHRMAQFQSTGPLQIWDAATGCELASFLNGEGPFNVHDHRGDGRAFVAVVQGDRPNVWRICGVDLEARREWRAEMPAGHFASVSPSCDCVALHHKPVDEAGDSCAIVETRTGRTVAQFPDDTEQTVFAGNGACVVAGYCDDDQKRHIHVVHTATGKTSTIGNARFLGVSPDARWIIAARGEDGMWLWDVARACWHVPLAGAKAPPAPPTTIDDLDKLAINQPMLSVAVEHYRRELHGGAADRSLGIARGRQHYRRLFELWQPLDSGRFFASDSKSVLFADRSDGQNVQWTLHDIASGKPVWKRAWEEYPAEPLFTPDARRMVVNVPDSRVEIINTGTGETERTVPVQYRGSARLARHGQTLVIADMAPEEERHWLFANIEEWFLRNQGESPAVIRAVDLETGVVAGELRIGERDDHWLTEDGRTLVTFQAENFGFSPTTIRCWDMPPRKPLRWVLGVPLSLGVVLLTLRFGWPRLRASRAVATSSQGECRSNSA
jgi:hypothetical protein